MRRSSASRSAEPAACDSSPQISLSWPNALAANTANSTNWLSVPAVMLAASTSWAPTHSTITTLDPARKMMIAVSIARARIE